MEQVEAVVCIKAILTEEIHTYRLYMCELCAGLHVHLYEWRVTFILGPILILLPPGIQSLFGHDREKH